MNLVVDASFVVRVLKNYPDDELVHRRLVHPRRLHAPHLIDVEVASAIRGHVLGGKLGVARAGQMLAAYELMPIQRHPMKTRLWRSFELRDNLTSYDAMYVALAEALQCPLYTVDAKFAGSVGHDVEIWRPADPLKQAEAN